MSIQFLAKDRGVILSLLALVLLSLGGCEVSFNHDPVSTVTLEISQVKDQDDRDSIEESLSGMVKSSGHVMTGSWLGEMMTVKLSPVDDVKKFSRRIKFGKVTDVTDRTIKVQFIK